jgi:hypothetical protein
VKNEGNDISGFHFSPSKPDFSFQPQGPFGFVEAIAISQQPTITITVKSNDACDFANDFNASQTIEASFLGRYVGSFLGNCKRVKLKNRIVILTLIQDTFTQNDLLLSPILDASLVYPGNVPDAKFAQPPSSTQEKR